VNKKHVMCLPECQKRDSEQVQHTSGAGNTKARPILDLQADRRCVQGASTADAGSSHQKENRAPNVDRTIAQEREQRRVRALFLGEHIHVMYLHCNCAARSGNLLLFRDTRFSPVD